MGLGSELELRELELVIEGDGENETNSPGFTS